MKQRTRCAKAAACVLPLTNLSNSLARLIPLRAPHPLPLTVHDSILITHLLTHLPSAYLPCPDCPKFNAFIPKVKSI